MICESCNISWGAAIVPCGHCVCEDCETDGWCPECFTERNPGVPVVIFMQPLKYWIVKYTQEGDSQWHETNFDNRDAAALFAAFVILGDMPKSLAEAIELLSSRDANPGVVKLLSWMRHIAKYGHYSEPVAELSSIIERANNAVRMVG